MLTFHKHSPISQSYDPYREDIIIVPTYRFKTELEDDVICPGSHSEWQREDLSHDGLIAAPELAAEPCHCGQKHTRYRPSVRRTVERLTQAKVSGNPEFWGRRESKAREAKGGKQRHEPSTHTYSFIKRGHCGEEENFGKTCSIPGLFGWAHSIQRCCRLPFHPRKVFFLNMGSISDLHKGHLYKWIPGCGQCWKGLLGRRQLFKPPGCPS